MSEDFCTQPINKKLYLQKIARTQSRTEDRYITSVAPYQLGHTSFVVSVTDPIQEDNPAPLDDDPGIAQTALDC